MTEVEQLQAMMQIMQTQRNIASDQVAQLGAQVAALQQEIAQLKKALESKGKKTK